jgi:LysM repeat protein
MDKRIKLIQNPGLIGRIFSILIVLGLLVSAIPQPVQAAPTATCSKMYTVVSGDTLSKIALQFNVTVQALADANNLKEPYVITVGQVLCIPGTTTTGGGTTGSTSKAPDFTVTRDGNRITVKLVNFTPKRPYRLTIGPDSRTSSPNWIRLGLLRTNKAGVGQRTFQLPRDFRERPSYRMCLKDQVTDAVMCKNIRQ